MMLKPMFSNLKEIVTNKPTFKKEWTDKDEKTVNRKIKNLFFGKTLANHNGVKHTLYSWEQIENFFRSALYFLK